MSKNEAVSIRVVIKGEKGSGKTTVMNVVGSALKAAGFNVACIDDCGGVAPRAPSKFVPDDRLVRVMVKE